MFQECRRIEPPEIPYSPNGDGKLKPVYQSELNAIAERLKVEI